MPANRETSVKKREHLKTCTHAQIQRLGLTTAEPQEFIYFFVGVCVCFFVGGGDLGPQNINMHTFYHIFCIAYATFINNT